MCAACGAVGRAAHHGHAQARDARAGGRARLAHQAARQERHRNHGARGAGPRSLPPAASARKAQGGAELTRLPVRPPGHSCLCAGAPVHQRDEHRGAAGGERGLQHAGGAARGGGQHQGQGAAHRGEPAAHQRRARVHRQGAPARSLPLSFARACEGTLSDTRSGLAPRLARSSSCRGWRCCSSCYKT